MNEPPPVPLATVAQAPPMMLGYAAMPRRKSSLWMGIQYAVAMVLAVLGPTVLIVYLIWVGMMGRRGAPTSEGHLFGATMVLTFSLLPTSFAIWLRQRVLRQRAALDPSAPLGSWLDRLHALAPWGLVIAGAVVLALAVVCAAFAGYGPVRATTRPSRTQSPSATPLLVAGGVGTAALVLGLGSLGARSAAARRLIAQRRALVPVASVVARPAEVQAAPIPWPPAMRQPSVAQRTTSKYPPLPQPSGKMSLGVQYALSLGLAVLGGMVLVIGVLMARGNEQPEGWLFHAMAVLTVALPALSFSLWLRQRVLRQKMGPGPVASLGRREDVLYAMAPWCMVASGGVVLSLGAAYLWGIWSAFAELGAYWALIVPLGIVGIVGAGTLATGLAVRVARKPAHRVIEDWTTASGSAARDRERN